MIRAYELKRGFHIEEGSGKTRIIYEDGVFIPYPSAADIPFMASLRDFLTKWCYDTNKGEKYQTNSSIATLLLAAFDKRNLPRNQIRKELSLLQIELSERSESEKREALLKGEDGLNMEERHYLDTLCRFALTSKYDEE